MSTAAGRSSLNNYICTRKFCRGCTTKHVLKQNGQVVKNKTEQAVLFAKDLQNLAEIFFVKSIRNKFQFNFKLNCFCNIVRFSPQSGQIKLFRNPSFEIYFRCSCTELSIFFWCLSFILTLFTFTSLYLQSIYFSYFYFKFPFQMETGKSQVALPAPFACGPEYWNVDWLLFDSEILLLFFSVQLAMLL